MSLELAPPSGFEGPHGNEEQALRYLQEHIPGPGYLIPSFLAGYKADNREIDALVVLPDAVAVVELKHYRFPRIVAEGTNVDLLCYASDGRVERRTNPSHKLTMVSKTLASLVGRITRQYVPCARLLIFTAPGVDELVVRGREIGAEEVGFLDGVYICRLPAVLRALDEFRQNERSAGQGLARWNAQVQQQLRDALLGWLTPPPPHLGQRIASYIVEGKAESKDEPFRLLYGRQDITRLMVWLKEYQRDALSPQSRRQAELRLLLRDAVALTALSTAGSHPNLPVYLDYLDQGNLIYVVLKREPGAFLRQRLAAGDLELNARLAILRDLLAGLAHIHGHQEGGRAALYRDLRPESVFVTSDNRVLLFNLDCSRLPPLPTAFERARKKAQQETWSLYASPELLNAQSPRQVDTPTDVYSWGVVAYELLTGKVPYPDQRKAMRGQFAPLETSGLPVPSTLRHGIQCALSPIAGDRPTVTQLQAAFQEAGRVGG